jgi:hypothetical protein
MPISCPCGVALSQFTIPPGGRLITRPGLKITSVRNRVTSSSRRNASPTALRTLLRPAIANIARMLRRVAALCEVTIACGLVTIACGLITIACGLVTIACGLVTIARGLITIACGLVTIARGLIDIRRLGTLASRLAPVPGRRLAVTSPRR